MSPSRKGPPQKGKCKPPERDQFHETQQRGDPRILNIPSLQFNSIKFYFGEPITFTTPKLCPIHKWFYLSQSMKRDFVVSIKLHILDWDLENMLLLIPLYFTLSKMGLSGKTLQSYCKLGQ